MDGQTELGWEIIVAPLIILAILLAAYQIGVLKTNVDTELASKCAQYPELPICKTETEPSNYVPDLTVATTSTEALTCAINSVAAGSAQTCVQKFSGGSFESSTVKKPVVKCSSEKYLSIQYVGVRESLFFRYNKEREVPRWEFKIPEGSWLDGKNIEKTLSPSVLTSVKNDVDAKSEENGLRELVKNAKLYSTVGHYLKIIYLDSEETFSPPTNIEDLLSKTIRTPLNCNVKNFNLPQKFDEYGIPIAKDAPVVGDIAKTDLTWIGLAGDPKHLVYSQYFPVGEEKSWGEQAKWYQRTGNIIFTGICAARVLSPIAKVFRPFKTLKDARSAAEKAALQTESGALKSELSLAKDDLAKLKSAAEAKAGAQAAENVAILSNEAKAAEFNARFTVQQNLVDQYKTSESFYKAMDKSKLQKLTQQEKEYIEAIFAAKREEGFFTTTGGRTEFFVDAQTPSKDLINYIKLPEPVVAKLAEGTEISGILAKIFVKEATTSRFLAYTAIPTTADAVASYYILRIASQFGKYTEKYPNSIVLQNSMRWGNNLRAQFSTNGLQMPGPIVGDVGVPVILQRPQWGSGNKPLYLVSPCKADLTITKGETGCSLYSYNMDKKLSYCAAEKEGIFETRKKCGELVWYSTYLFRDGAPDGDNLVTKEKDLIKNMKTKILFPKEQKQLDSKAIETALETFTKESKTTPDAESIAPDILDSKRQEIVDGINNFIYYYNPKADRIDFISKNEGKTLIWVPEKNRVGFGYDLYSFKCEKLEDEQKSGKKSVDASIEQNSFDCKIYNVRGGSSSYGSNELDVSIYRSEITSAGTIHVFAVDLYYGQSENSQSGSSSESVTIGLKDDNRDGYIDGVNHRAFRVLGISQDSSEASYNDLDSDGVPNEISATNCKTDAVIVGSDQDPYTKKGDGYNFCYEKTYQTTLGFAATTGGFALSATTKFLKIGGVAGWALGAAFDCGLAIAEAKYGTVTWPGTNY